MKIAKRSEKGESKNRPVAANYLFLKILAPLGQLLVGGVPAQNPAEEVATNWKLSIPVSVLIRSCYFTYDSAWIANSHAVRRNIMNHDTASADDYIITN